MLRYPTVLFDWDGCLARTLEVWMQAYSHAFARFGLSPTRREIGQQFGNWRADTELGVPEADHDEFLEILDAEVSLGLPDVELYTGARELVSRLHDRGVVLAIITSSPREKLLRPLDRHDIAEFFSAIVTAEDVTKHKPDAEPIEKALSILRTNGSGAVMIGDSTKDLGAANNAGIDSVLVHERSHSTYYDLAHLQLYAPTHTCRSLAEVGNLLLG